MTQKEGISTMLIVGNWKMNGDNRTWQTLTAGILVRLEAEKALKTAVFVVCPPCVGLENVGKLLAGSAVKLGAQNVHWAREGAHTGEVSAPMLRGLGVSYVIIGHSERRIAGEAGGEIAKKVAVTLKNGLTPIVCIGETLAENEGGLTQEVLVQQLAEGLAELPEYTDVAQEIIVAYEPVWAIGTGKVPTTAMLAEVFKFLRQKTKATLLYGGSVTADNAGELSKIKWVGGFLIGGASLNAESFVGIGVATGVRRN